MNTRVHPFTHAGIDGAVIRVLEPDQWDLNRMLPHNLRLPSESVVTFTYACHFVRIAGRSVMVDGGYHARETSGALETLGVSPGHIDIVLITHGDGDHVAGFIKKDGTLTFPEAQYVLHSDLWEHWHDRQALEAMSDSSRRVAEKLAILLGNRVTILDREIQVADGIRFLPSPGHRHGHATYEFSTPSGSILHFGDTLFHPLFAEHPDWPDTMALSPVDEVASRGRMLARAVRSDALVLTGHLPFPGIGFIRPEGAGYRWVPLDP